VPLSAHFGAPKYLHLIHNDASLQRKIKEGNAWFGPLSAFLLHSLTGQAYVEPTIANRSLLLNLKTRAWDPELCRLFQVPDTCLPPLVPSFGSFGKVQINSVELPVLCVLGDQQAALVGQGGRQPGSIAMNFGTSGSVQMNTGQNPVILKGLISSPLLTTETQGEYMLEGTINACNALFYWLESELFISHRQMQWDKRCEKTETDGVYLPGFVGLASPYWKDNLKTHMLGLEKASKDEIIRAAMESIGFLVYDILQLMNQHRPFREEVLVASGGGARPPLLQFIADLAQIPIGHTPMKDCTAFGIYCLLREGLGETTPPKPHCDHVYSPQMKPKKRGEKIDRWKRLLKERGVKLL
jgi:glycerol kinase